MNNYQKKAKDLMLRIGTDNVCQLLDISRSNFNCIMDNDDPSDFTGEQKQKLINKN